MFGWFKKKKDEKGLKLSAQKTEDLDVLSSLLQDALILASDMAFDGPSQQFTVLCNRYRWELQKDKSKRSGKRIRCAVQIHHVHHVQYHGSLPADMPLNLLSIDYHHQAEGSGKLETIILHCSNHFSLKLSCDGLRMIMSDLSEDWDALSRPNHTATHHFE